MRALALIALFGVASCGDDSVENKAAPVAAAPSPGQWELTSQVTRFRKAPQGTARIDTPVGTRATQSLCVAPGRQLPSEMFSGDGFTCRYTTYYVRNGNANVSISCHREGLAGSVTMTVAGTFEADRIRLHRNLRTVLADGDVELDADITGRRTGACTPAAASEGQNRQ